MDKKTSILYNRFCEVVNNGKFEIDKYKSKIEAELKLPIQPHQVAPIVCGLKFKSGCFFLGMGAGKTFIILSILKLLKNKIPIKAIVLCPKSVIGEWKKEIEKFGFDLEIGKELVITNYEQIQNLERKKFDVIVLDESQKIKNPKTRLFKNVVDFSKNIKNRFVLTGTPDHNNIIDVYTQISFVNPFAFNESYNKVLRKYFIKIDRGQYSIFKPTKVAIDYFKKIISRNALVFKNVSENITVIKRTITCQPNSIQKKFLEKMQDDYFSLFVNGNLETLKKALVKEVQISSGFLKIDDFHIEEFESPKMATIFKYAQKLVNNHGQVIVWVSLIHTGKRLERALMPMFPTAFIHGGVSRKTREMIVKQFVEGKLKVLIIQILTGNFGMNLQNANTMIFAEPDWNANNIEQAIARCARTGQDKPVFVYFFITKDTVEEYMLDVIKNKKKISKELLYSKYMRRK